MCRDNAHCTGTEVCLILYVYTYNYQIRESKSASPKNSEDFHTAWTLQQITRETMAPTTPLRRSARTPKPRILYQPETSRISKPTRFTPALTSPKSTRKTRSQILLTTCIVRTATTRTSLIEDTAESESEDEPESEEHIPGSIDNMYYRTADVLDRRDSLDSRYESGNEEYELDGFVVADEYLSDGEGSVAGSDVTLLDDEEEEGEEMDGVVDGDGEEEDGSELTESSVEMIGTKGFGESRKMSTTSMNSSGSGLFVSDQEDPPVVLLELVLQDDMVDIFDATGKQFMALPLCEEAAEDVAEDIHDAICFFSRRCNRSKLPLMFRLDRKTLEDEEVSAAIEQACRLKLGQTMDLGDGTQGVRVGPL